MKIDRNRWRELASDYVEGTLPDDQAEAVRAHLREDAESRAEEAGLRGILQGLNTLPEVDPPPFFADNVMAAIHRQEEGRRPWWAVLPTLSRPAYSALAFGGAAAVVAWALFIPRGDTPNTQAGLTPHNPSPTVTVASTAPPALKIERSLRVADDPMYEFAFTLENADRGSARCTVPGDPEIYRLGPLTRGVPQTLQVPVSAARGEETLALRIAWNADGKPHSRFLSVPVARKDKDVEPAERQSFGLGEMPMPEAAREISARYGVSVTLEDVPEDLKIAVVARDESAADALRRLLQAQGYRVDGTAQGVIVAAPTSR